MGYIGMVISARGYGSSVDIEDYKQQQRELWSKGDWSRVAHRTQPVADQLVSSIEVAAQDRVLEVAAGTGNGAAAAARRGAVVTASDLSPAQVEKGRARTAAEGLTVDWHVADIEGLPFEDASFDKVICCFGVLFVPRPDVAMGELFRVLRSGGKLGMANWARDGWQATMSKIVAGYLPSSDDRPDIFEWGDEGVVAERVRPFAEFVGFEHHLAWAEFDSAEDWWETSVRDSPMLVSAKQSLEPDSFAELGRELIAQLKSFAGPGPTARWGSAYLITIATKK